MNREKTRMSLSSSLRSFHPERPRGRTAYCLWSPTGLRRCNQMMKYMLVQSLTPLALRLKKIKAWCPQM